MSRSRIVASLVVVGLGGTLACREDPPRVRHEPMQAPAGGTALLAGATAGADVRGGDEWSGGEESPAPLAERPPADPAIGRAIDLIGASGLRFVDQAADEDSKASEYTAEQFAAMLRTKWDWIGYDIGELDPWLEEIAARSFKSNLPYQVVLADGSSVELRGWLDQQLAASEDQRQEP